MMQKTCPTCGSSNLKSSMIEKSTAVPYGPAIVYEAVVDHCDDCRDSGDFAAENDERIDTAIQQSTAASVESMLKRLSEEGISSAFFERALRLPVRTVSRWKTGKVSASALALVRLVRTYKWLLYVADSNFDQNVVAREAVVAAASLLGKGIAENTTDNKLEVKRDKDVVTINASYRVNDEYVASKPKILGPTIEYLRQETACN